MISMTSNFYKMFERTLLYSTRFIKKIWNFYTMFYSVTQSFLNFLRILNRLEVYVFARAVKLESPYYFKKMTEELKIFLI
jgi:hypothetical protein